MPFRRVKAPERAELETLVQSVSERVGRHLERQGLLVRDAENGYLALEPEGEEALAPVLGSSITYRIALGPHQGRKAFTLRTLAPERWAEESSARVAQAAGFSLHAGVLAEAGGLTAPEPECSPRESKGSSKDARQGPGRAGNPASAGGKEGWRRPGEQA